MITLIIPISMKIVVSYTMKQGIPIELDGKSMETKTRTWSEFPYGGKTIVEQILVSDEKINSRSRTVRVTVSIQVEKLTIWVRSLEREKLVQPE